MIRAGLFCCAAALGLAGCTMGPGGLDASLRPEVRPDGAGQLGYVPSPRSQQLRLYYTRLENDQMVRGLMRTDGGTVDAPFNARMLADNFIQIALFDEHPGNRVSTFVKAAPSQLRRWSRPVRLSLIFGESVPDEVREVQQTQARAYANRLAQVTGHPIRVVPPGQENFTVYVVDEDERRGLEQTLRRRVPGIGTSALRTITQMPRTVSCLVVAFSQSGQNTYTDAVAIIRAEHPPASWRSCLHEEVAQGLGLPNDSPRARPSIFNDDEEFALLTRHDELLLSILYDDRLRPGMEATEAEPIIRTIADEKFGAGPV